jgi:hypothetical protein
MIQRGNIWHRNVPWATGEYWRTDISTNTLCSTTFHFARYALKDGPIVQVPMNDLRDALIDAPIRKDGTTVGPYNIDPFKSVIEVLQRQTKVRMEFGPFDDLDLDRVTTYHSKTATHLISPDRGLAWTSTAWPIWFWRESDQVRLHLNASLIDFKSVTPL